MINRNIERALVMIDELRAGTREISLHRGETDLPTLIKRAAEMSVIPSNVNFTLNIGEGLMGVTLDGELMQRVLVNLMRNAVDAMPNGGSLAINAGSRDRKTVIEVTDTGCGIPDDILPEIFDTFYTTKPKGLGLGLAFSRRVIEAHGGEITVNTKLGEGTTFTITLPST
jgi:signal transduction histidine kinase